jgi:hypothetical protein
MPKLDTSTLEAALIGYQAELLRIDAAISTIRKQLGGRGTSPLLAKARAKAKVAHHMSAAGRKAITDAQHKRWAVYHAKEKASAKAAKKARPKRKLSPERKAALLASLAKARAARAAKKAATA